MSRVLKSSSVNLDKDNAISIEVMDAQVFSQKARDHEAEHQEISVEVRAGQILFNARNESEGIIRAAQFESQVIMQNAKEQAEKQAQIVMQNGYKEGYEEGYRQGTEEAEGIKNDAQSTLEQAVRERDEMISSIESDMVDLIINVLNKLLADTKVVNHQIIMNLIKQGLNSSSITGEVKIHVSDDDIDSVIANKDEILSLIDTSSNIEIVKDAVLEKFDCVIETPFGNIDCSLDQQYEALRQNLYYILNGLGDKI